MCQLFFINHDIIISGPFIIKPVILASGICRTLLLLLGYQSFLHTVHLLLGRVDLDCQSLDQVLLLLDLLSVLQDCTLKALAILTLSLVLNESSLLINGSSLLLACLFLFTGCTIRGRRVLLLFSILRRATTEGRLRLKFRGTMGV